jgi:DNA-binding MarR family transcriptional regulator
LPGTSGSSPIPRGLVSRRPDPHDGRVERLEPTDDGRAVLADDRLRREGRPAGAIEAELSAEEQEPLARAVPLLARLADAAD